MDKSKVRVITLIISVVLATCCLTGCSATPGNSSGKNKLVVFEADSLMIPMAQVEKEFESAIPISTSKSRPTAVFR
jgi:ABC-type molybdate transport system substrate-binding protein